MEFTVVAVLVLALEVVDAVGDIGGLLDLCHETASADGVDAASRNEKHVTLMHRVAGQGIGDGIILHHLLVLVWGDLLLQTVVELCIGCRIQGIPHLRLAARLALALGNLIRRVHLDAKILTGVDKLDEQWELIAEALEVFLADKSVFLFAHQLVEALALVFAIGHDRLIVFNTGNLPTFSDALHLSVQMLEGDDPVTSPDGLLQ